MPTGTDLAPAARDWTRPAVAWAVLFGAFLTLRGYHSFDGDQAYRLPILLHAQDPAVFGDDPFVRAFDAFNPHRGYLALVDAASRPLGMAAGLLGLFALTCVGMAVGVSRLARAAWPEVGGWVGWVAVGLVLLAKAGNIGTNHLFEATLLDRLIGFALGWVAMAGAITGSGRGAILGAGAIGVATLIHPSVGLQLGATLAAGWLAWAAWPGSGVSWRQAAFAVGGLGLGLVPGLALMAGQGGTLFEGLPAEEFRALAVWVQGPQHMVPSHWRMPQWLAWGCYPVLAGLALGRVGLASRGEPVPAARVRLALLIGVNLASLLAAYLAVEVVGDLRVTLFQPFRMATLARGLALVAVAGRAVALLGGAGGLGRVRAAILAAGLVGDWAMVVATGFELALSLADVAGLGARGRRAVAAAVLATGGWFLLRHDIESGYLPLGGAVGAVALATLLGRAGVRPSWNRRRVVVAVAGAWAVPALALVAGMTGRADPAGRGWAAAVMARCRFAEVPTDDLERLAVWARGQTPPNARFIGPPGPKTFRLWSRRAVAFNRAASPYHARGLADWADRFRDHVGFHDSTAAFVRAYLADRHALEARFRDQTGAELAALAARQGAGYVLVEEARRRPDPAWPGPLTPLHRVGRYAIYRVDPASTQGAGASVARRTEVIPALRTAATASLTAEND